MPQTRWGRLGCPQFGQTLTTAASIACVARRLSRRDFEVFRFGTAICGGHYSLFGMKAGLLALAAGLAIGWVDSRPTWDDTGITAGAIVLAAGAIAWWRPRGALVWGLLVAGFVPLFERTWGSLLALAFGLGAAGLVGLERRTSPAPSDTLGK